MHNKGPPSTTMVLGTGWTLSAAEGMVPETWTQGHMKDANNVFNGVKSMYFGHFSIHLEHFASLSENIT